MDRTNYGKCRKGLLWRKVLLCRKVLLRSSGEEGPRVSVWRGFASILVVKNWTFVIVKYMSFWIFLGSGLKELWKIFWRIENAEKDSCTFLSSIV